MRERTTSPRGHIGTDQIYGGTGNDTVFEYGVLPTGTVLDGGAGNNTLYLVAGDDSVYDADWGEQPLHSDRYFAGNSNKLSDSTV